MPETILVVDDEKANRDLLEAILSQQGYEVRTAPDGPSAIAAVGATPPDLILLDLLMPGLSGLEVCQQLKTNPATAGIPIIVVTAVGQVTTKETALTTGADDFVTKPVRPPDLRARVEAMLKVRRIRQDMDRTLAYLHELDAARHVQRRAALTQVVAEAPTPPRSTGIPVLLVDDEPLTRDFYGDLLAEHGFRVFAVPSGAEGLELMRQHSFEVAILDILMPQMTGLEVLDRMRSIDPDLPVVMLTGHPSSQYAIAALKLGALDFIVKGLDHHLIILAVHRAVRHRREALERKSEFERMRARIAELERPMPRA